MKKNQVYCFVLSMVLLLITACQPQKMLYTSDSSLIKKNQVKRMLVYESNQENVVQKKDNLVSRSEYDRKGNILRLLTFNPYQMDSVVVEYFYENNRLIKESSNFDMYPTEMTYEYDASGRLVRSKLGGAEPRKIEYTYNNKGQLILELGQSAFFDVDDSVHWITADSTVYSYEGGLLRERQFYYLGELLSHVYYEMYNDAGQCLKELNYGSGNEVSSTTICEYDEKGLLISWWLHDFYDDHDIYRMMIYEYYRD